MGFFSDMIKMAASEVVNAVMESVNENAIAQEEKELYIKQIKEKYAGVSYELLVSQSSYDKLEAEEIEAIKIIIEERNQLAKTICESPEEVLCDFDDEDLVAYYEKLIETKGDAFPEDYKKKVVKLFQNEVMSRPIAKRIYSQDKEEYFENYNYNDLQTIVLGNNIFYDEVLKEEAKNELERRNYIIQILESDAIDELDNNEFMQLYALVRADKTEPLWVFDGTKNYIDGTYNKYFGEHRSKILKTCENEITTNRKFLISRFISEYCEEEIEEYSDYPNKKLSSLISQYQDEDNDYDLCDKLIAEIILSERGGE